MPYRHTPRSVLYTGPALAGVMGLSYLFGSAPRTASTSFNAAKAVAPMHVWGVVFLVGCVTMTIGLISRNQRALAVAYFIGGVMYAWWGSCFLLQALTDPHASFVAWALYAIVSMTHFVVAQRCWVHRGER
jgi:hypothetical protein